MKRIRQWLKTFIIKTIVDDYQHNGPIRRMIVSEQLEGAAIYGGTPGYTKIAGRVIAGNAFETAPKA